MKTIQRFPSWFSKQKLSGKVAIGCASLIILCCLCSVPISILSPSTPISRVENTAVTEVASTPTAIETVKPTDIPQIASTNTPEPPTPIPNPTETPDPYIYLFEVSELVFLDHDANRGNGEGLKVYMGEQKLFIFEIIGGGDCSSMPSGQGYLVRYPDTGNVEWKDRRAMEESELFVENDSYALYARDWKVYYNCP
jgi:hypothetical protein